MTTNTTPEKKYKACTANITIQLLKKISKEKNIAKAMHKSIVPISGFICGCF
jgi:hypothetical protein